MRKGHFFFKTTSLKPPPAYFHVDVLLNSDQPSFRSTCLKPFPSLCPVQGGSSFNPLTAVFAAPSLENNQQSAQFEVLKPFIPALACERICIQMHNIENNLLWDQITFCLQACMCPFQPRKLTSWGSERVKTVSA